MSDQLIQEFIAITGADANEAKKYVQWGNGNLEVSLNYFFRKMEKEKPQTQKRQTTLKSAPNAFKQLQIGQQKQKELDRLVKNLQADYTRPLTEEVIIEKVQPADNTKQDLNMLSTVFNDQTNNSIQEEEPIQPLVGKKQDILIEDESQSEPLNLNFPLKIGTCRVKGQAQSSQCLSGLDRGSKLKFKLERCQPNKKQTKANKQDDLILRIIWNNQEIGRLEKQYEDIFAPLIVREYITLKIFHDYAPIQCKIFDSIYMNLEVYLQKVSISQLDDQLDSYDDSSKIFLETREQFYQLFQLMRLEVVQKTLINYNQSKQASIVEDNYQRENSRRQQETQPQKKDLFNPFDQPVQKTLAFKRSNNSNTTQQPQLTVSSKDKATEQQQQEQEETTNNTDYEKLFNLKNCQTDLTLSDPVPTCSAKLHDYQRQALTWMLMREGVIPEPIEENYRKLHPLWQEYKTDQGPLYFNPFSGQISLRFPKSAQKCKGGILADEMGLGKTVMLLSLIHSNNPPTATRKDMMKVLKTKTDPYKTKEAKNLIIVPLTLIDQWEKEAYRHSLPNSLTIYQYRGPDRHKENLARYDIVLTTYGTISYDFSNQSRRGQAGIFEYDWFRIILDEAHYIKGRTVQSAQAIYSLRGYYRWCLSGTPIQNKLDELFSLIHFIKLEPWSDYHWWNTYINKPFEKGNQEVLEMISVIIKPILIRRTKKSRKSDGTYIINLPQKNVILHTVEFSEKEQDMYKRMEERSKEEFEGFLARGVLMSQFMQMFELILRLRQMCDHPFLILTRSDVKSLDELERTLDKFLFDRVEVQSEHPDMIDGQEIKFNRPNIAQKQSYKQQLLESIKNKTLETCPICMEIIDDTVVTICLHLLCRMCMKQMMQNQRCCPICRTYLTKNDYMSLPRENSFSMQNWTEMYTRSAKIHEIFNILNTHVFPKKEKCIIFTQFINMIELISLDFQREGIAFLRLDGSLTHEQRTKTLDRFKQDPKYKVFIISLKSGGVGLNLTVANHVIMVDPWWNPAVEDQAAERVYRIGQEKEVFIHRLIVKNSIEERMLEMHQTKKYLFDNTINTSEDKKEIRANMFKQLLKM